MRLKSSEKLSFHDQRTFNIIEEVDMKKTLYGLLVISLILGAAQGGLAADKTFKLAFMPGIADPFYFTMEKGAQAKAKELGVELIVGEYPGSWGPGKQL